jgi:predicted RNA-binding Zn-ribbon protein involved in translation (DUF1610 family)
MASKEEVLKLLKAKAKVIIVCPECGSDKINQYRMPTGPIWCEACGLRVEQKEKNNPFITRI